MRECSDRETCPDVLMSSRTGTGTTLLIQIASVFHGIRDFANAQKKQPSSNPSVVVIKSIYGSGASLFGNAPYHASKFCAHGVMKQAAIEYARPERGIPQNSGEQCVPGFSKTP